jgi:hypothetical protein
MARLVAPSSRAAALPKWIPPQLTQLVDAAPESDQWLFAVGTRIAERPPQSGRIEARTGLRMVPTSPRSPYHSVQRVFPSAAGRMAFRTAPSQRVAQLKPAPGMRWPRIGLPPSFVHRVRIHEYPAQCRVGYAPMHRRGGWVVLLPRGPRSGPGYAVPVRHHLIDPIRPTRRHIVTSPQSGLYAMPSLCA